MAGLVLGTVILLMSAIREELELQQHGVWNFERRKVDIGSKIGYEASKKRQF
jgi:hypothetical protein